MFPQNIQLTDLLTFFLFADLIVMLAVGIYSFKTRNKKGKTEQLLEKICDLLTQNQPGCTEKPTNKSNSDLTTNVKNALKKVVEIKQEDAEEKRPENKPKQELPSIDPKNVYYEIEEATEAQTDELSDLILVKNALKDGPVIKSLLKMPKYIDDLVNKSRQSESAIPKTEVDASAKPTISSLPPPPPPPVPIQTTNTKDNERKESD